VRNALSLVKGKIDDLTESNRQLREGVEAVEMENKRLSKENDRLREELEKVKAELKIADNWSVTQSRQRIATLTTTLAAAKEALLLARPKFDTGKNEKCEQLENALARIAECEKETAP
jgi:predicted RNase H-like nuclease (RuvC/YqgF family)